MNEREQWLEAVSMCGRWGWVSAFFHRRIDEHQVHHRGLNRSGLSERYGTLQPAGCGLIRMLTGEGEGDVQQGLWRPCLTGLDLLQLLVMGFKFAGMRCLDKLSAG